MDNNQMEQHISEYLYGIGSSLISLGETLCQQIQSTNMNIHGQVKEMADKIAINLHNLSAELEKTRFNLLSGKEDKAISLRDAETLKVALFHLLHGKTYTHNGQDTDIVSELHKLEYIVSSLYRMGMLPNSGQGVNEYTFDKIHEKDI